MNKQILAKARAKSLAEHFKKSIAHLEKMSAHNDSCQTAHTAMADDHEKRVGKSTGPEDFQIQKTAASFHKTMSTYYEQLKKSTQEQIAHYQQMLAAYNDDPEKAAEAFKSLNIDPAELAKDDDDTESAAKDAKAKEEEDKKKKEEDEKAAKAKEDEEKKAADDEKKKKEDEEKKASQGDNMSDPNKVIDPATKSEVSTELAKQFNEGLAAALKNGLDEALKSPEFKKTVQEQIGNMLLSELGKQSLAPTPVKTFAVPRTNSKETIASGATPKVSSEGIDPEFASLVSMEN